jgi:hypothetical protein
MSERICVTCVERTRCCIANDEITQCVYWAAESAPAAESCGHRFRPVARCEKCGTGDDASDLTDMWNDEIDLANACADAALSETERLLRRVAALESRLARVLRAAQGRLGGFRGIGRSIVRGRVWSRLRPSHPRRAGG